MYGSHAAGSGLHSRHALKVRTMTEREENAMSIPTSEQETVVQYDRNGETMTVYTTDSTQITRLDKIYQRHKEHKQAGEVVAVEYVVDKKLLSYRSKRVKPVLSDEQRAAARARLQTMREKRLQANG